MPLLQPMGIKAVAEGVGQFNSKVDSMNKSITKSNKAMDKTEKSGVSFSSMLGKMAVAAGIATGAFIAVKKALAFGREGALITQTGESFEFLLQKIGASSDLLSQLQVASKGTITDLQLMSSTATLLAGAGDELAVKLADATPRLLEIAKAANKLNPALGDTAFLYQSIATGVKRAQPLILDNLGITIKVGEANEAFAKSIGKTVEELTAEEKAMAILEGTLEAGDNLIQQVGGSTDSLTDSFDRATVATTQAGDAIKKKFAPFLANAAEGLALFLTFGDKIIESLGEQELRTRESATTWEEYNTEIERVSRTAGFARDHFGGLTTELQFAATKAQESRQFFEELLNPVQALATAGNEAAEANRSIVASLGELTQAKLAQEAIGALNAAYKAGEIDADTYRKAYVDIATNMAGMSTNAVVAQLKMFRLNEEFEETGNLEAYIEGLQNLGETSGAIKKPEAAIDEEFLSVDIVRNLEEAALQAAAIAVEAGDVSAWTAATDLAGAFGDNIWTAFAAIQETRAELEALDGTTIDVLIDITTAGGLPEFQHGGQFTVGGKPGVDQNLVAFRATRGEVVTVTPTSNVDNRSVSMGDVNIGKGALSPTQFDRMIRDWMGD